MSPTCTARRNEVHQNMGASGRLIITLPTPGRFTMAHIQRRNSEEPVAWRFALSRSVVHKVEKKFFISYSLLKNDLQRPSLGVMQIVTRLS